jgi:hypothetical protein
LNQSALSVALLFVAAGFACSAVAQTDPAAALRAKHASLREALQQSPFERPLILVSGETATGLQGDIYAVLGYPFGLVAAGLSSPQHWCDMLLLHINTKYCYPVLKPGTTVLQVNVGKKTPEDLAATSRIEFAYQVALNRPDYMEVNLDAEKGPLGTSHYRFALEAVALNAQSTFVHLSYSYATSFAAQLAIRIYLGSIGSDKVGFTVLNAQPPGLPVLIGDERGAIERNTMRYFLAIDSFVAASRAPAATQFEQSLQSWFTATEHYARQLHEMDRAPYLEMKRSEYQRQQTQR